MELTAENYYSNEADYEYMSVSQYKSFVGSYGRLGCEASAMAYIRGEIPNSQNQAMLIGSYVDAYFSGELEEFRVKTPELFRQDGELKAPYKHAEYMIERASRDPLFVKYMSGQHQVIMTGELFGTKWKCKMDSYHPGIAIVDMKCMQSLTKLKYTKELGYLDFVRYWGYDIQGAVYREIVRQNTGETLQFYIAGISTEEEPDLRIIRVKDAYLTEALEMVERNMPRILDVKYGGAEPNRCELCPYCRRTRVLEEPMDLDDLTEDIQ